MLTTVSLIIMPDIRMEVQSEEGTKDKEKKIVLSIDPLSYVEGIGLAREMFASMYDKPPERYWLRAWFKSAAKIETTDFKVSLRLARIGIKPFVSSPGFYDHKNIIFLVEEVYKNPTKGCGRTECHASGSLARLRTIVLPPYRN